MDPTGPVFPGCVEEGLLPSCVRPGRHQGARGCGNEHISACRQVQKHGIQRTIEAQLSFRNKHETVYEQELLRIQKAENDVITRRNLESIDVVRELNTPQSQEVEQDRKSVRMCSSWDLVIDGLLRGSVRAHSRAQCVRIQTQTLRSLFPTHGQWPLLTKSVCSC